MFGKTLARGLLAVALAAIAWALTTRVGYGQETKSGGAKKEVQRHLSDETRLLEIKANPERYVGKPFILCGEIKIGDYYNFAYSDAQESFYSLDFTECDADTLVAQYGNDRAHLYLLKEQGRFIIDQGNRSRPGGVFLLN